MNDANNELGICKNMGSKKAILKIGIYNYHVLLWGIGSKLLYEPKLIT